jgi:hypothetical protein
MNRRECIGVAFAALGRLQVGALVEQSDPFFMQRRDQFALLAARYAVPAIYEARQFAEAGGFGWCRQLPGSAIRKEPESTLLTHSVTSIDKFVAMHRGQHPVGNVIGCRSSV